MVLCYHSGKKIFKELHISRMFGNAHSLRTNATFFRADAFRMQCHRKRPKYSKQIHSFTATGEVAYSSSVRPLYVTRSLGYSGVSNGRAQDKQSIPLPCGGEGGGSGGWIWFRDVGFG